MLVLFSICLSDYNLNYKNEKNCSNVRPLDMAKNCACGFVRLVYKYPITSFQKDLSRYLSQFLMTTAFSPSLPCSFRYQNSLCFIPYAHLSPWPWPGKCSLQLLGSQTKAAEKGCHFSLSIQHTFYTAIWFTEKELKPC